jgi:hypothetical protein
MTFTLFDATWPNDCASDGGAPGLGAAQCIEALILSPIDQLR